MKKLKVLLVLIMYFGISGCQLESFEIVEASYESIEESMMVDSILYPDISPLRDFNNFPITFSKWLEMRGEIFFGAEEPVDNGKGYYCYLENFLNDNGELYRKIELYVMHPFKENSEVFGSPYDVHPFPFYEMLNTKNSTDVIERILAQKLKILDPPSYYKKIGAEYMLEIDLRVYAEKGVFESDEIFYITFIGNKYMRVYYSIIPAGASEKKFVMDFYTYIYPAYVELIEPYLNGHDEFLKYKESIVYMDLENAV